jgi:TIR domain
MGRTDVPDDSPGGIFLSYRREDAAPYARLLQYQLTERFPDTRVFMDLDSIEAGLDFAEVIAQAVGSCAVLVALIGRQWATMADEEGQRRLDDPDDYVRFEVQAALERGVRVIPVLVDGASPLRRQQLPPELGKLARLNALELSYGRYQFDADRLLDLIQRVLAAAPSTAASLRATVADDAEPEPKPIRPPQQPATADMIETMMRRLEASRSASPYLRDTVAELRAMGYELSLPKPHLKTGELEKYIKFMDPASPGAAVAYMRAGFLIFSRPSDQNVLRRLPGAIPRDKGDVKFAIDGRRELEAARKVKR